MINLTIPISEKEIRSLKVGDVVSLNGVMLTARDTAHKYMVENFIQKTDTPESEKATYEVLKQLLKGGIVYHCGPVVAKENGKWRFVSAGPTTSIREEVFEDLVIEHFGMRGVIGKGGMGPRTLAACQKFGAVYFHAIGGAATVIADSVKEVEDVYKFEFGVPEAFWRIRVEDFVVVVTMDSHGNSIHDDIEKKSKEVFQNFLK